MPCIANKSAWSWVQIFCTWFAQEWILHKVPGKWSIANVKTPWSGSQLPCSCVSIYSSASKVPLNQNRNSFYTLWMHKSGHIVLLELQAICTHLSPSTCFAQQVACNYLIIKIIGIFTLLALCRSRRLPSNFYTSWECKPDVLADFQVGRLHRLSKSPWYFWQAVALLSSSRGSVLQQLHRCTRAAPQHQGGGRNPSQKKRSAHGYLDKIPWELQGWKRTDEWNLSLCPVGLICDKSLRWFTHDC